MLCFFDELMVLLVTLIFLPFGGSLRCLGFDSSFAFVDWLITIFGLGIYTWISWLRLWVCGWLFT